MQNDVYTKAVLIIIAVAMSIIVLNPWIAPPGRSDGSQSDWRGWR
jgi:hypothetical protein